MWPGNQSIQSIHRTGKYAIIDSNGVMFLITMVEELKDGVCCHQ